MLNLLKIVTCLLLIQGLYTVDSLAIGGCVDRLTAGLINGAETCLAITDYVKCLHMETDLFKTPNKVEDLRLYKRLLEDGLAEKGIICDIDVMAIAEELLENDRKGIEHKPTRPKGYKNAETVGDCIWVALTEGDIDGKVTCDHMTPYFKCLIRVTKAYSFISSSDRQRIEELNQTIKDYLNNLNVNCDFNLASLIEDVRREQGGHNGSSPQQGNGKNGSSPQQGNGKNGSSPQQGNGKIWSSLQQGNGENGASMVVGSFPFVTLFILTCALVFLLY